MDRRGVTVRFVRRSLPQLALHRGRVRRFAASSHAANRRRSRHTGLRGRDVRESSRTSRALWPLSRRSWIRSREGTRHRRCGGRARAGAKLTAALAEQGWRVSSSAGVVFGIASQGADRSVGDAAPGRSGTRMGRCSSDPGGQLAADVGYGDGGTRPPGTRGRLMRAGAIGLGQRELRYGWG